MASGIQAAPFSVGSNAFRPSGQLQQSQQNFVGNMRSPGNPVRNQFQQQLGNDVDTLKIFFLIFTSRSYYLFQVQKIKTIKYTAQY